MTSLFKINQLEPKITTIRGWFVSVYRYRILYIKELKPKTQTIMRDRLIPKSEILKILKIHRKKFEELVKIYGLPMVHLTPYKKYIRESHLNEFLDKHTINLPHLEEVVDDKTDKFKWKPIFGGKKWDYVNSNSNNQ